MNRSYRPALLVTSCTLFLSGECIGQQSPSGGTDSLRSWVGQRILILKGLGEVHRAAESSRVRSSVGINLVSGVARAERSRLWIRSTSGNDSGWVDTTIAIRLSEAIPYLSAMIARDSANWDLYLRRAEAEHALNQREAATVDYTTAIRLHPTEAFLHLRRGRHYNTVHECDKELADFEQAIALRPTSAPQGYDLIAELYSLESVVYSGCPDSTRRDPQRARHDSTGDRSGLDAWYVLRDSRQRLRACWRSSGSHRGSEARAAYVPLSPFVSSGLGTPAQGVPAGSRD
jgi:tetratricopeptide (TPR) repeat protein